MLATLGLSSDSDSEAECATDWFAQQDISPPVVDHDVDDNPTQSSTTATTTSSSSSMLSSTMASPRSDWEMARRCQFFSQFPYELFNNIFQMMVAHDFEDGENIVEQGQEGNSLWLVAEGAAKVVHFENDKPRLMTTLFKGKLFGELSLLYGGKRTATVQAIGPTRCLELCKENFEQFPEIRNFLVIQQLPLLAVLSPEEQVQMTIALQPREFVKDQIVMGKIPILPKKKQLRRDTTDTDTSEESSLASPPGTGRRMSVSPSQFDDGVTSNMNHVSLGDDLFAPRGLGVRPVSSDADDLENNKSNNITIPACNTIALLVITKGDAKILSPDGKRFLRVYEGQTFSKFDCEISCLIVTSESMKCMTISNTNFDDCVPEPIKQELTRQTTERAKSVGPKIRVSMKTMSISVMESSWNHDIATSNSLKKIAIDGDVVINNYRILKELGKGTYGKVYKCCKQDCPATVEQQQQQQQQQGNDNKNLFAVKVVRRAMVKKGHRLFSKHCVDPEEEVLREVNIMKELKHDNIVRLFEVIDDKSREEIVLVMEHVDGGDVMSRLPFEDNDELRNLFRGLLRGIEYLHSRQFIHCDIKPANMLMTSEGQVKICDFGISRLFSDQMSNDRPLGTPAFMAPELLAVGVPQVTYACDVWGLGASLYMFVVGQPPWIADNEFELMQKLQQEELTFPSILAVDPRLQNLIMCMLVKDAEFRITLPEVMQHEWVTNNGAEPMPRIRYRHHQHLSVGSLHSEAAATTVTSPKKNDCSPNHNILNHNNNHISDTTVLDQQQRQQLQFNSSEPTPLTLPVSSPVSPLPPMFHHDDTGNNNNKNNNNNQHHNTHNYDHLHHTDDHPDDSSVGSHQDQDQDHDHQHQLQQQVMSPTSQRRSSKRGMRRLWSLGGMSAGDQSMFPHEESCVVHDDDVE